LLYIVGYDTLLSSVRWLLCGFDPASEEETSLSSEEVAEQDSSKPGSLFLWIRGGVYNLWWNLLFPGGPRGVSFLATFQRDFCFLLLTVFELERLDADEEDGDLISS